HEQPLSPVGGVVDDIAALAQSLNEIGGGLAIILNHQDLHALAGSTRDHTTSFPARTRRTRGEAKADDFRHENDFARQKLAFKLAFRIPRSLFLLDKMGSVRKF